MPAWWVLIISLFFAANGLIFALATLWVYTTVRFSPLPFHEPLDPEGPCIPPVFQAFCQTTQRQLYPLGFNLIGCLHGHSYRRQRQLLAVLLHPLTGDWALAKMTLRPGKGAPKSLSHGLLLISTFTNGSLLVTHNTPIITGWNGHDEDHFWHLPWVTQAHKLYQIHRRLERQQQDAGRLPTGPPVTEEAQTLNQVNRLLLSRMYHLMATGEWYLSDDEPWIYPTWRGAARTAWREVWPGPLFEYWQTRRHIGQLGALDMSSSLAASVS